jgi:predicted nucleotidyltransferase
VENLNPKLIILFGSYARGDYTDESDIDVCIVAENLPENIFERRSLSGFYRVANVRAVGYFPEEFLEELEKPNLFLYDILEEGIVIHCDRNFLKKVIEKKEENKRRFSLIREPGGWRITKKKRIVNLNLFHFAMEKVIGLLIFQYLCKC